MALAAISSFFSPNSSSRQKRLLPKRNSQKKQDNDFVYPSQTRQSSRQSSIVLGSTISESQFDSTTDGNDAIVLDNQSACQGNDSINLSSQHGTTIPNSLENVPDSESPNLTPTTMHSRHSMEMFDALSRTNMDDSRSSPSLLPMSSCSDHGLLSSTPLQNSHTSSDGLQLFVSESQFPPSQSMSQKHVDTLRELICANTKIANLEAENKQLRDDLNVTNILRAANINMNLPLKHSQKVQTDGILTATQETETTAPIKNDYLKETLLFRSDGNLNILSNFYSMRLNYKGMTYHSAEQAYQHQMALYHARSDLAYRIMVTRTAAQSKRESKVVRKSAQWHEYKHKVMSEILLAKSNQLEAFKSSLLKTGQAQLLHNIDTDSYWGCGSDLKGDNMMGVLLMELRRKLALNPPKADPKSQTTRSPRFLVCPVLQAPKNARPAETSQQQGNGALDVPIPPKHMTKHKQDYGKVLVIGNSNAREMSAILNNRSLNAQSFCYPGGTITYLKTRIRHLMQGPDPSHIIIMAGDVEAANGLPPATITQMLEGLLREVHRVYPWSRIILVELTMTGNAQRRHAIQEVNSFVRHLSSTVRLVTSTRIRDAKLKDNIHLTLASKRSLGQSIVTAITRPWLDTKFR